MKLYYTPGACSQAVHIALAEAGLPFVLEKVDLAGKKTASGEDFRAINPLGYVPVLELDNGYRLTEVGAILQYVADQAPAQKLAPPATDFDHYRLLSLLNFISTELHKGVGALFGPNLPDAVRQGMIDRFSTRFEHVDGLLAKGRYLLGDSYGIADIYLFVVSGWLTHFNIDIGRWPRLAAWRDVVAARPAVRSVLATELGGAQ